VTAAKPSALSEPPAATAATAAAACARRGLVCRLVDHAVPTLPTGRLQLTLPNGETIERRGDRPGPEAAMAVHRWRGLWRMLRNGDHGFADGYLDGDWSTPELGQLIEFCMHNEAELTGQMASSWPGLVRNRLQHLLRANTRLGSRRNITAHYDLGNDFFRPWLDEGMNYSSALFDNCDTLERAQAAKLDRAAALLELTGGERVLEIGCGWGALAERLIRHYGSSVFGITLSQEQLAYARTRLAGEVEDGNADLRLLDYRDVAGRFDRIASIEMIEAVGERYWPSYFGKIRACLAGGGVALLQAITIDERRFAAYRKCPDFIQRYIFPGGVLPTLAIIEREAARAGLKLVHHESFGDSYVRTLREWRSRFLHAWPKIEGLGFNERFRRMWEYYLAYCEVGFRLGTIDVGFFKLAG
jgi:cyclopropane-fatty-acyl-phospholipid synthase